MAAKSAREAVLRMLQRVFGEELFLDDIFDEETAGLSDRDRSFSRKLVLGVLEKKPALDPVIGAFSSVPLRKLKPKILRILEIAAYEILFLQTAPYASVNEAVSLTRRAGLSGLSGFVNAVLRKTAAEGKTVLSELDSWQRIGMTGELRNLFTRWYGEERGLSIARAMCESKPRTVIRRSKKFCSEQEFAESLAKDGLKAEKTGLTDDTWYTDDNLSALLGESFKKGFFYIQDLSSCMAAEAVSELRPKKILDVCSAPGGKLLQVLDRLPAYDEAAACDLTEKRTDLIRENLLRLPYENVRIREADASIPIPEYENRFDLVIADLPCSGLGTLSKNPELRYRTSEETLGEIQRLQEKILENICRYAAPGGTLLYSTCTINPAENEAQISGFLERHPEFSRRSFTGNLPDCLKDSENGSGELQILPDRFPGSGFYIARLEKTDEGAHS